MPRKHFVRERDYYDKVDERYEHDEITGRIRRRDNHRVLNSESVRIQIEGQRRVINMMKWVYWLRTGTIADRPIIPIDGDYCNLRFDNLKLKPNLEERLAAQIQAWHDWVYMSRDEQQAFLAAGNPEPRPPC